MFFLNQIILVIRKSHFLRNKIRKFHFLIHKIRTSHFLINRDVLVAGNIGFWV